MTTKVINIKSGDKYDVLIDRRTKYGNPFMIGRDGNRDDVVRKYRAWILTQPDLLGTIHELRDKTLGCWCDPLACHGHVLVELIERMDVCNL